MTKQLLKAFIIGSSFFAFILFFLGFGSIQHQVNKNNCVEKYIGINTYGAYTIIVPFYLGLMSAIAIYIQDRYDMSIRKAFFLIGIISAIIVSIVITALLKYM